MAKRDKTNTEIRRWYLEQISVIPGLNRQWLVAGLQERAQKAYYMRHHARLQARAMMKASEAALLRARDQTFYGNPDGPTFEYLVNKGRETGLTEEEVYEAIIDGSYRTDAEINRRFGL